MSENVFYGVIFLDDEPVTLITMKRLTAMLDQYVDNDELDPEQPLEVWTKPGHPAYGPGQPAERTQVGFFVGNTDDLPSQGWTRRL